jgi:hypothetical protein
MPLKLLFTAVLFIPFMAVHGQIYRYFEPVPVYSADTLVYSGEVHRVTDYSPVAGVEIYIQEYGTVGYTNKDGAFTVKAPVNITQLFFRKPGYTGASTVFMNDAERARSLSLELFPEDLTSAEQELILENYPVSGLNEATGELLKRESLLKATAKTEVPVTIRVLMPDNSVVVMNMDEYLKGVVPSEVPPSWNMNALKAQAVAARSYATSNFKHSSQGADVCTTTHCQAWKSTHNARTDQAVAETSNMSVKYGADIINALFFSHCDGHTRNNEDVWGGTPVPYLRSKSCTCGYTFHNAHGVGMCQYGSQAMALAGSSWESILTYYYTGTVIDKPNITLGTLTGVIYYGNDNQNLNNRITGATVRLNTGQEVISGTNGLYSFDLVPGQYTVTASKTGFVGNSVMRDVTGGATIWGSIQLSNATGIDNLSAAKVLVYPNPARDYLTIEPQDHCTITIHDLTGRQFFNYKILGKTTIPLDNFKSGVYILTIVCEGYTVSEKVVIMK